MELLTHPISRSGVSPPDVVKVFINLSPDQDATSILMRGLTNLISEFSKIKESSLPYNLPVAGRKIAGRTPLPKLCMLCKMQTASFRFWTRVALSISYNDNHCTTNAISWYIKGRLTVLWMLYKTLTFVYIITIPIQDKEDETQGQF